MSLGVSTNVASLNASATYEWLPDDARQGYSAPVIRPAHQQCRRRRRGPCDLRPGSPRRSAASTRPFAIPTTVFRCCRRRTVHWAPFPQPCSAFASLPCRRPTRPIATPTRRPCSSKSRSSRQKSTASAKRRRSTARRSSARTPRASWATSTCSPCRISCARAGSPRPSR